MTPSLVAPAPQPLVIDSGPMLCMGGARELRSAVIAAWYGRACWVQAVRTELVRLANGHDFVAKAAQAVTGTRNQWLGTPVSFGTVDEPELARVRARVVALDRIARRRRGQSEDVGPGHHAGEVQSILHARRASHAFASNDHGALKVAREHHVNSGTMVDLARMLVAAGADAWRLARDLNTLESRGIRTGEAIRGPMDLFPRRQRHGTAHGNG